MSSRDIRIYGKPVLRKVFHNLVALFSEIISLSLWLFCFPSAERCISCLLYMKWIKSFCTEELILTPFHVLVATYYDNVLQCSSSHVLDLSGTQPWWLTGIIPYLLIPHQLMSILFFPATCVVVQKIHCLFRMNTSVTFSLFPVVGYL